jgi:hypothetical protein
LPGCGDGIISGDEECDDGAANSDNAPDRCRTSCVAPSCGDGVVDLDEGEGCEPPGTLLCTADCAPRPGGLGLAAGQRTADPDEGLARCQRALVAQGVRAFGVRRRAVLDCVHRAAVCVAREDADAPDADACFARAERRCAARAGRSDAVVARTAADTDARCGAPLTVANLLDPTAGLGLAQLAATCPFGEERAPRSGDVTACAMRAAACAGETAAGQVVPRAVEYLASLEFDAATAFPCLLDPSELEIGDGWFGSASGAFTGDADTTAARR